MEFTEKQIKAAKEVKEEVIHGTLYDWRHIYMAGEICMWDEIQQAKVNGADTSNYKALPIQSVSGSAFAIAISDGFVTYEYPLRITNDSIQKVHWKICDALGVKPEEGRILRHYR